jgi:hypothetical protein
VVAYQDEMRSRSVDGEGEAGEVGVVGHAGFVDEHDGPVVQSLGAVVESGEERSESAGLDVRFGAEGAGSLAAG